MNLEAFKALCLGKASCRGVEQAVLFGQGEVIYSNLLAGVGLKFREGFGRRFGYYLKKKSLCIEKYSKNNVKSFEAGCCWFAERGFWILIENENHLSSESGCHVVSGVVYIEFQFGLAEWN